jgi:hypothetical protein
MHYVTNKGVGSSILQSHHTTDVSKIGIDRGGRMHILSQNYEKNFEYRRSSIIESETCPGEKG